MKQQWRYRKNFNSMIRLSRNTLSVGSDAFERKEYFDIERRRHKLAPVADFPSKALEVRPSTVVLWMSPNDKRVTHDRIVEASVTGSVSGRATRCKETNRWEASNRSTSNYVNLNLNQQRLDSTAGDGSNCRSAARKMPENKEVIAVYAKNNTSGVDRVID